MSFAMIGGLTLHYRLTEGSGQAPAIVFVNSLGTDFRIWENVVTRLADDFTLLLHDKRGHGLSDTGAMPQSMDDHARDLAGLLDHLGIMGAVICGVSVGGMVAQALWGMRPDLVRGLILCDTAHQIGTTEMWNARIEAARSGRIAELADPILERWFTPEFKAAQAAAHAGYRNMLLRTDGEGYAGTCMALRDADLTEIASRIDVPTLCVVGEQDGSTPPDVVAGLADLVPGARLERIAGSGHLPCIDNPEILAGLVRSFVAGLG
ncbi:MAG: 3-oxoadipate enol-lactonase [Rhodobacteraceae bacterium]|nr:3-oxoadipate enol-lactonase [Paracoccaceae bacterium]